MSVLKKLQDIVNPNKKRYYVYKTTFTDETFEDALKYLDEIFSDDEKTNYIVETSGSTFFADVFLNRRKPLSISRWKKLIKFVIMSNNESVINLFIQFISNEIESTLEVYSNNKDRIPSSVVDFYYNLLFSNYDVECFIEDSRSLSTLFPLDFSDMNDEYGEIINKYLNKINIDKKIFEAYSSRIHWPKFKYRNYNNQSLVNEELKSFLKEIPGIPEDEFMFEDNYEKATEEDNS